METRYAFRYLLFSLALLIAMLAGSGVQGEQSGKAQESLASVLIDGKAAIAGSEILLGNIAAITSSDAALADRLRKVSICPAAEPGFSRTLHIGYVKSRVRQQGILPESINWSGAKQAVVETKVQYLSPEEILSYAEEFIKARRAKSKKTLEGKNPAPETSEIQVQPINKIRPTTLPCGEVAVKVESMPSASHSAIIPLRIIISVDGRECEKRAILFKVTVLRKILVTARALNKHKVIEEDDLRVDLRDIGGSPVFLQKKELIGMRAKKSLSGGTAITGDMVEGVPVVNKGDLVTIIIESRTFRITAQGEAREAGARDQIIRVMNTSSRKEITAQVVGKELVRVAFLSRR